MLGLQNDHKGNIFRLDIANDRMADALFNERKCSVFGNLMRLFMFDNKNC